MTKEGTETEPLSENDALLEQENPLFRAIFDSTFSLMGVLSPEGTLLEANETALELIGVKKDDVIGIPFWKTPWWSSSPELQEKIKQAVQIAAQGEFVRFDACHLSCSGQPLIVDFSLTPVFDTQGKVEFLVPEGRDITERIAAEQSLREREARNRALVESAPVGICTITTNGIIETANEALHKLLDYAKDELHGKPATLILETLYDDKLPLKDALKTGERKLFGAARETLAMRRDGSKVPVELVLSLLNLGKVRVFIVIVRDISELRKSQQLQAQLAAIVESTDDAIYGGTLDTIITSWNPAAERLYGHRSDDAIGRSVLDLIMPEDRKNEFAAILERLSNGESISHLETVRKNRAGKILDVDLTVSPMKNPQGHVIGVSTIARDISARKIAERRISEFYSMVSHELRTPLTSIRASLGLLEGGIAGNIDEEALQLVQIARAESDRLILLINDILDLQKIEAGMLELKLRQVHLSELINTVAESLRAMADEHGIRLKASYPKDWTFIADRDRMIQVLHNLLSNAIKYSFKSGIVKITAQETPGAFLRISIIDQGPGIKADQLHKLFGKFQQVDSSDSRPQGGTGLGLAISKAIIEQHNGSVGVLTNPGEGSSFWFEIPLLRTTDTAPITDASKAAKKSLVSAGENRKEENGQTLSVKRSPAPPCVLVVEDDKSSMDVLLKKLTRLGINCISATDGQSALKILQKIQPNLLILDVGLPGPEGFELVKILKESALCDLPLLVFTSRDLSKKDLTELKLGPSKHITKSMASHEDIIQSVKELLGPLLKEPEAK